MLLRAKNVPSQFLWQDRWRWTCFLEFLSSFIACSGAPEFSYLMSLYRGEWLRCLLWHGWLPGLSCNGERDPWAASFGQLACLEIELCLGVYPPENSDYWAPLDYWDADDIALVMYHPNNWTDGKQGGFLFCRWVQSCWRWCLFACC